MKPQFGKLKEAYDQARRGYPIDVYNYLLGLLPDKSVVLDVGCGTGISTRELAADFSEVIGSDNDLEMLKVAEKYNSPNIKYVHASAQSLPFKDENFDVVTAFGAFHWFCDAKSIQELKRVLKKDGFLVVVNKKDQNYMRKLFDDLIKEMVEIPKVSSKENYTPNQFLNENGLNSITEQVFQTSEIYTMEEALLQVQSWNAWSYVPDPLKGSALEKLKRQYEEHAKDGCVERVLDVVVVTGVK